MSLHSDTLFSFRANQSLLFLLNAACLRGEATNNNFIVIGLTRAGFESTIYRTQGEHANHYATDVVQTVSGGLVCSISTQKCILQVWMWNEILICIISSESLSLYKKPMSLVSLAYTDSKTFSSYLPYLYHEWKKIKWFWFFDFWCFNVTFSNISVISWRPVLVLNT